MRCAHCVPTHRCLWNLWTACVLGSYGRRFFLELIVSSHPDVASALRINHIIQLPFEVFGGLGSSRSFHPELAARLEIDCQFGLGSCGAKLCSNRVVSEVFLHLFAFMGRDVVCCFVARHLILVSSERERVWHTESGRRSKV